MECSIFTESSGTFSWRKAGTALCFLLFATSVLGYNIANNWEELPASYMAIIAGVFVFYFAKRPLENLSFSTKAKQDKE